MNNENSRILTEEEINEDNIIVLDTPQEDNSESESPMLQKEEQEQQGLYQSGKEKRNRSRFHKLASENSYLRSQLDIFNEEISEKNRLLEEYQNQIKIKEQEIHKVEYDTLQNQLNDTEEEIREKLLVAKNKEEQLDLTEKLFELKNDRTKIEIMDLLPDHQHEEESVFIPENKPVQKYQKTASEYQIEENLNNFYEKNSWADRDSKDYNPEMSRRLDILVDVFDKDLQEKGESEKIGTEYYFDILEGAANNMFSKENKTTQRTDRGLDVSRNGSSMADVYLQNNTGNNTGVSLTAQELQTARSIGAGLGISEKEAIDRFAKNKSIYLKQSKNTNDQNYIPLNF